MDRNIQKYQAFVAAAEEGNITRAAAKLSFSQSSVSKMIADLEESWQVQLLSRSRSGVQLTKEGRELMPLVRKLLAACEELDAGVQRINGVECGSISIGVFSSVAEHWMPEIISLFQRDHPGISYELLLGDYGELEEWLSQGRVDCAFLPLPAKQTFAATALQEDPYQVILPCGHPLSEKKTIAPEDLEGQPFLLLEHGGKTEVSAFLEKYHVTPDIRFTTWDDYAIMAMAERGQGIALLPSLILQRIPYHVEIRPLSVFCGRTIGIAHRRERPSAALSHFLRCVLAWNEERKDRNPEKKGEKG